MLSLSGQLNFTAHAFGEKEYALVFPSYNSLVQV